MTLAGWFLPLLRPTLRRYAGSLRVRSSLQFFIYSQPLAVRRTPFLPHAGPHMACLRISRDRILILTLAGCLFVALALGLRDAARSTTGETLSSLHVMALGSWASAVFRLAEARPLTTLAPLALPPETIFTLYDSGADKDDSSANPLPILGTSILPEVVGCTGWNGSTDANFWPFRYLTRPQFLKRV